MNEIARNNKNDGLTDRSFNNQSLSHVRLIKKDEKKNKSKKNKTK